MNLGIAALAIALLAVLVGSVWIRRAEWDIAGGTGGTVFGLALAVIAVALIVAMAVSNFWA